MNFNSSKAAIDRLIKLTGSSSVVTKAGGAGEFSCIGVLLASKSTDKGNDGFVSSNERDAYISGKINFTPEEGDAITFRGNMYAINSVTAYAVGEGEKNVFAYKLTVGTA